MLGTRPLSSGPLSALQVLAGGGDPATIYGQWFDPGLDLLAWFGLEQIPVAWFEHDFGIAPDPYTGPYVAGVSFGKVDGGTTITLTIPAFEGATDGVVLVKSSRSSNGNTATISDDSGSGESWTAAASAVIANASSAHYVWRLPFKATTGGATVTITWTGSNQGSAVLVAVGQGDYDAITTATSAGDGSAPYNMQTPAHVAAETDWFAVGFGGGRGNADGTQPTLDTAALPAGWADPVEESSTAAASARNAFAWAAAKLVSGTTSLSADGGFATTGPTNSRFTAVVSILPNAPVGSGGAVDVGLQTETDTALASTAARIVQLGLPAETDAAQPITAARAAALAIVSETDSPLPPAWARLVALGLATELDEALALNDAHSTDLGLAGDTSTALATSVVRVVQLGLATETDTPISAFLARVIDLDQADETDDAFTTTAARIAALALTGETDIAGPVTAARLVDLGITTELDTAIAILAGFVDYPHVHGPALIVRTHAGLITTRTRPAALTVRSPHEGRITVRRH
jgi:hypothetical protein